jgi:hypothetical protein
MTFYECQSAFLSCEFYRAAGLDLADRVPTREVVGKTRYGRHCPTVAGSFVMSRCWRCIGKKRLGVSIHWPEWQACSPTRGYCLPARSIVLFSTCLSGTGRSATPHEQQISCWLVLPCLILTFLFGPLGLLLYFAVRFARTRSLALEN